MHETIVIVVMLVSRQPAKNNEQLCEYGNVCVCVPVASISVEDTSIAPLKERANETPGNRIEISLNGIDKTKLETPNYTFWCWMNERQTKNVTQN